MFWVFVIITVVPVLLFPIITIYILYSPLNSIMRFIRLWIMVRRISYITYPMDNSYIKSSEYSQYKQEHPRGSIVEPQGLHQHCTSVWHFLIAKETKLKLGQVSWFENCSESLNLGSILYNFNIIDNYVKMRQTQHFRLWKLPLELFNKFDSLSISSPRSCI